MTALLVAVGAALGCPARYLVWQAFNSRELFGWGTLTVNVVASLLLGVSWRTSPRQAPPPQRRFSSRFV
ncbi:MAG: CrcB family protein, partial [Actinomycetota bacterium]|nr:CrcB family protein [Actinomycetota bacterium]